MKINQQENKRNIKKTISLYLMTFIDGMIIAYIYIFRSKSFMNMQTGNLVKFIIDLCSGVFSYAYLFYIFSFVTGLFAGYLVSKLKKNNLINIGVEVALLIPSIFLPLESGYNVLSLALLSAFFGIQFGNGDFRKAQDETVTTNMQTNNMRLFSESLGEFICRKSSWKKPLFYLSFILCFCLGVAASSLLINLLDAFVVLIPISMYIIIFILYI